ncbi:hypothetical protein C8J56DRAFT_896904 [Mycena floridula]|nr:hypothetical protein C8J56DRAFT_896904 [Mycena floridula]
MGFMTQLGRVGNVNAKNKFRFTRPSVEVLTRVLVTRLVESALREVQCLMAKAPDCRLGGEQSEPNVTAGLHQPEEIRFVGFGRHLAGQATKQKRKYTLHNIMLPSFPSTEVGIDFGATHHPNRASDIRKQGYQDGDPDVDEFHKTLRKLAVMLGENAWC